MSESPSFSDEPEDMVGGEEEEEEDEAVELSEDEAVEVEEAEEDDPYASFRARVNRHGSPPRRRRRYDEDDDEGEEAEDEGDEGLLDEEEEDDWRHFASPRHKSRGGAAGRSSGGGTSRSDKAAPAQSKWQKIKGGIPLASLADEVEAHGIRVAAGRGFTKAGKVHHRKSDNVAVQKYRCLFRGCPAQLRTESTSIDATIYRDANRPHNDHIERTKEGAKEAKGVPGELKALLTPTKLALEPKRLRAYLRTRRLHDGTQASPHHFRK